jgi:predicted DNA-binding transcriptional regulator AlpA
MPRQSALPPTMAPRLLAREASAAYACLSPNTFDGMVKDGRMPKPRLLGSKRLAWDVRELDAAIDALPHDGEIELVHADEGWEN